MLASSYSEKEVIRYLIEKGANINAKTSEGLTALYFAAFSYHYFDEDWKHYQQ